MKCRVLKGFIDKNTGKAHECGSLYECEKARFDEINSKGNYLAALAEKPAEIGTEEPNTKKK